MHRLNQQLLHLRQLDGLLVAALTLHTGRDAADDDDGVGHAHLLGQVGEVGQLAFADVAAQHGELSIAATVFYADIVCLPFLYIERLVVGTTASEAEATATAAAALVLLDYFAIDFQNIAVVGRERVFHLTREGGGIFAADADREVVVINTLGKAPGSESGEVQLVVIGSLHWFATELLIIPELHLYALAVVEVLQMVDGCVLVVEFASFLVDNLGVGQGSLDAAEQ